MAFGETEDVGYFNGEIPVNVYISKLTGLSGSSPPTFHWAWSYSDTYVMYTQIAHKLIGTNSVLAHVHKKPPASIIKLRHLAIDNKSGNLIT
jgi:hypothetical protein